jgi:hypothetical protein
LDPVERFLTKVYEDLKGCRLQTNKSKEVPRPLQEASLNELCIRRSVDAPTFCHHALLHPVLCVLSVCSVRRPDRSVPAKSGLLE